MEVKDLHASTSDVMGAGLDRLQRTAMGMALVGLLLSGVAIVQGHGVKNFFPSYLFAYMFWVGVTCGSLGLLMLHHTVGGGWGFVVRRFLEAGSQQWWVAALLFIPVVFGLFGGSLYPWAGELADTHAVKAKGYYLTIPFFLARAAVYFLILGAFATVFKNWGRILDERNDPKIVQKVNQFGGIGILVMVLTVTFMSVDWMMSLTPDWASSIFGLLAVVSQCLSTLALYLCLLPVIAGKSSQLEQAPRAYFRDLGNFTLAFVMLWAYMAFSQYLITFSGNTTEEITFYVRRTQTTWMVIGLGLILFHFAAPFLALLTGSAMKRDPVRLGRFAFLLILMRFIDLWWVVLTTFRDRVWISPADIGAPLLIGGIWLWCWANSVRSLPLVPANDPRVTTHLHEVTAHG